MSTKITRIIKRIINEEIDSNTISTIFSNHPGSDTVPVFYGKIIPIQYPAGVKKGWWANSCAAKMSMAMNKTGFPPGGEYYTDVDWNGVKKGTAFNPSSQAFKKIFRKYFGEPSITFTTESGQYPEGTITPQVKGKPGVFVFSTNAWGDAAGHVDAFDGKKSKGGHEYWGIQGTWEFWSQVRMNAKNCGWGDDEDGYEKSNWICYDDPTKSSPAKNAKKCGWGKDVKGYRESGWKCKV